MGLLSLLIKNPAMFVMLVIPLLYSVISHEVAHGWTAYLFGDKTAKNAGRLSFNPLVHIDPIGTLALFLVGFGWAKPVPVNYANLRNFRVGLVCVSMAGVTANILIATAGIVLLRFTGASANQYYNTMLVILIKINIVLGAFNLIPIPPLDGAKIVMGLLPGKAQISFARLEPYGFFLLVILLFTGVLSPVITFVQKIILLFISFILRIFA